ncbi:glycoside hydrolase family 2 protein [Mucilaginibacter lacusdianchii]|uniref:glycoside hydrolase family 2 protein n=1 Tax=Mucilaginibacter lacusdianchii TaxID=2684211 RepID=UPI00131C47C9|nr:glycoside hydrolase family 2 TIM barrel-domain containing protein [Mucilaginibacter sp. JXJ CY 39]
MGKNKHPLQNLYQQYKKAFLTAFLATGIYGSVKAQTAVELNTGWKCAAIKEVNTDGVNISKSTYNVSGWMPATVPGTVLTTLLDNHKVPDPFYGMNNERIKDIYDTGRDYYTYWFVNNFKASAPANGGQVYLNLRGINYSCDVFVNGRKLNARTHYGMFLRQEYNITQMLDKSGNNRLAVVVCPPDPVGKANGGQGGDGRIAKNVGLQYTAGWDWIQPMRDRNTGIWDKVTIETTGKVNLKNPHVITLVPGVRKVTGPQQPAIIKASAELQNPLSTSVSGTLQFVINGNRVSQKVVLKPNSTTTVNLGDLTLKNPNLWWPNGYGKPYLYPSQIQFYTNDNKLSDQENINVGVREIQSTWNSHTNSQQISVNGQKVFIKGGNWIISDAMLRLSDARYDAEVRFHKDMNLNLIRVWGGALIERPEFYNACDKYGMLVFQDFWISGDANGKWVDPMKAEDQWTRRKYPDNHQLFLQSAADGVKLVRNHPSLAIWCGGNEITPPEDILTGLRDSIIPKLDGTRWFVEYSNSDKMSLNTLGGNGDGPYGIQPLSTFWETRTFPFNSEIGSVGVSDYESLKRFIPEKNLVAPEYSASNNSSKVDSVWDYHKYIGYDASIEPYGKAKNAEDFANKAQLVNYDQYRALAEGFSSHMWDWYTGVIIWKTQNPWTAMRGQMYDYYLDPNACLYGLHNGSEPLHVMYNPITGMVSVVNNTFETKRDLMLVVKTVDMQGKESPITQIFIEAPASSSKNFLPLKAAIDKRAKEEGTFLSLQLQDVNKNVLSDNLYWLPDAEGNHSGLKRMPASQLQVSGKRMGAGKVEVTLTNPSKAPVAFFNRVSLVNSNTKKRVLPVFYSDNYVSVLPGEERKMILDYQPDNTNPQNLQLSVSGWNFSEKLLSITN